MAERVVSPGVFTRETDLSFLPQLLGLPQKAQHSHQPK